MPDNRPPQEDPRNWSEAFGALPLASPEQDLWPQLARELRPAMARNRRPLWWSIAAALTLLASLPLAWRDRSDAPAADAPVVAASPRSTAGPERETQTIVPAGDAATRETIASGTSTIATIVAPESGTQRIAEPPPKRARSEPGPQPAVAQVVDAESRTGPDADDHAALQSLYAQSAQLEALLAQMQDERMASGPAAAMAGQFETRLALIDASLSQPSLEAGQRADLWRERVDALRQLAGFESTQRWLTAQGQRYDGQLVAVY